MSRTNLLEIVNKYGLFERERKVNTIEEVLLDMRDAIHIDMINAEVMDPRTGRPTAATIAFKLGFDSTIIDSENHDHVRQLRGLDT